MQLKRAIYMQFIAIYRVIMPHTEFSTLVWTEKLKRTHSGWRIAMGLVSACRNKRVFYIHHACIQIGHLRYIIKCLVFTSTKEITQMRENIISFDSNFIFTNKLRTNTQGIIDDDGVTPTSMFTK